MENTSTVLYTTRFGTDPSGLPVTVTKTRNAAGRAQYTASIGATVVAATGTLAEALAAVGRH